MGSFADRRLSQSLSQNRTLCFRPHFGRSDTPMVEALLRTFRNLAFERGTVDLCYWGSVWVPRCDRASEFQDLGPSQPHMTQLSATNGRAARRRSIEIVAGHPMAATVEGFLSVQRCSSGTSGDIAPRRRIDPACGGATRFRTSGYRVPEQGSKPQPPIGTLPAPVYPSIASGLTERPHPMPHIPPATGGRSR